MLKVKEVALWKLILIRMSIILIILSISRFFLYLFNTNTFSDLSLSEICRLYFVGFRFDIHTLIVFNIPILIAYGIPFRIKYNNIYKKTIDIVFVITNSIAIALNLIDVIYFRYLDKRMSSELFTFLRGTDENQGSLIFNFITDFWYMFLIFFMIIFIIILLTRKTKLKETSFNDNRLWIVKQIVSFVIIIVLSVIGIRGGFQLKPINLLTATEYTSAKNIPIVINTPFSIVMSSTSTSLNEVNFFDDSTLDSIYNPIHKNLNHNRFIKKDVKDCNLVLIIIESFGQEMIGYYNPEREVTLTPFLDSLLNKSLTFDGMANGRRSIEALPSIFCGLPSLMSTDYPSSKYAINRLDGIGNILKDYGYKTAFFHGGNNGTMSFNTTAKSSGFDDYYGRNEYNNDKDFDGTWGIYDDAFLQYAAKKLNEYKNPFVAAVFTLSSHHPYSLPDNYEEPSEISDKSPFEKTVRYVDDALRHFFDTISKYDWYENTIFVITADHVNPEHKYESYKNSRGSYQIPIAFFSEEIIESKEVTEVAQHIDLGISILSALNINDTVFSFGRNIFDSIQKPSYINYINNIYQYSDGNYVLQSDGNEIKRIFDLREDKNMKNNLYNGDYERWKELDFQFKARLQQYNNRMINNKLYYIK